MQSPQHHWARRPRAYAFREAITGAAAIGFLVGGCASLVLGVGDAQRLLSGALYLPLGALVAAVLAGILVNLIALPALSRVAPSNRLPTSAYRAAGALSGIAAFAGAYLQFASVA